MIGLALAAVNALIPFFQKGFESFSGEAGKDLYHLLENKFTARGKQEDLAALKKEPDNERLQGKVESTLESIIEANRDLVEKLTKLIHATNSEAVSINNSKNVIVNPSGGYNFSGDGNHIEFHSTEPTVDELLSRAKNSLTNRDYKQAQDILNKVLERAPNDADVYYYLVLAILEGRRPKSLSEPEVSKIVRILDRAIERNYSKGQFFYLKAIIKYDYNYRSLGNTAAKFESYKLLAETINAGIDEDVETEILNLGPGMGKAIAEMFSNYKNNE